MKTVPIEVFVQGGLSLALLLILYIGRDKFGRYTLKCNPNSLLLPLFFDRLLKTRWKVIEWVVAAIVGVILFVVALPLALVLLLMMVLTTITVSVLGRISKANIWKDDKPPSMVVDK